MQLGNIRQTIQTMRGQHTAPWKSMRHCRRQDHGLSLLKYHYHRLPYCNLYKVWSYNRKCRQKYNTPFPVETLQIESKCLIVKFSSKLLDLSKGDMSCTVSVSHQLIKSKSQLNLNENHKILWNPDLTNWWNMFSDDNMLARAPFSVLSVHLWKFCNCNGQQFINLPAAHFLLTHPPALVDPAHCHQKHQNFQKKVLKKREEKSKKAIHKSLCGPLLTNPPSCTGILPCHQKHQNFK